jgi:hypothetical protein
MVNIFSTLANPSVGSPTIFNTVKDLSSNRLNKQLQNNFNARLQKEVQRVQDSFLTEETSIKIEEEQLTRYKNDVAEAYDTIQNTTSRLKGVLNRLDQMIINVNKAQESVDDTDVTFQAGGYAATHDSLFRQLDDLIQNTRVADNLLTSEANSVRYPINLRGTTSQIYGNDIKTNYYIEDSDGNKWYPQQDSQILKVYEDYPHTEGDQAVSMIYENGITLDSFSDPSVAFTIGADSSDPQAVTGTLEREGLELLNAWLYDSLETEEGRDRALEDIYNAKEAIKVELARFEMVTTTLNYYDELAKDQLYGIREEKIQIQTEAAQAVQDKQYELLQQYQAAQGAIAQSLVVKNTLRGLIPGLVNDSFTSTLLNVQV